MIKIELILAQGETTHKISNLLAMREDMLIHSNPAGQMFFALTENVRVHGEGFDPEDPEEVYRLLEREDVEVYFMKKRVFHQPDWNRDFVERICQEVCPPDA